MNVSTWFIIILLFILIIWESIEKRKVTTWIINRRKNPNSEEAIKMKELAQKFIGKECIVYTVSSETTAAKGVITQMSDNGFLIEYEGNVQAINLDYVTRIQEWPKNKKGKKKLFY